MAQVCTNSAINSAILVYYSNLSLISVIIDTMWRLSTNYSSISK